MPEPTTPLSGHRLAEALTAIATLTEIGRTLPYPYRGPVSSLLNRLRTVLGLL